MALTHLCCQIIKLDGGDTIEDSVHDTLCDLDGIDDTEVKTPAKLADSGGWERKCQHLV